MSIKKVLCRVYPSYKHSSKRFKQSWMIVQSHSLQEIHTCVNFTIFIFFPKRTAYLLCRYNLWLSSKLSLHNTLTFTLSSSQSTSGPFSSLFKHMTHLSISKLNMLLNPSVMQGTDFGRFSTMLWMIQNPWHRQSCCMVWVILLCHTLLLILVSWKMKTSMNMINSIRPSKVVHCCFSTLSHDSRVSTLLCWESVTSISLRSKDRRRRLF